MSSKVRTVGDMKVIVVHQTHVTLETVVESVPFLKSSEYSAKLLAWMVQKEHMWRNRFSFPSFFFLYNFQAEQDKKNL